MTSNENLPPSAQLALLHAQAANNEQDPFVPSPDDPVLDSQDFEPLIAGDYPTPIGKPISPSVPKKEPVTKKKLDLSSESAFPSLSASPRTPVANGGWSSAASRLKSSPQSRPMAPPATGNKKSSATQITDVFKLSASSQIANMPSKPLGFKSNADVIQQVIKKTGTNIIASTNRSGTTTFIIQGTPNDVSKAKKELIAGLVVKRTVELVVPASMRRFIIGPKGSVLAQIEAKSYTRINFPRKEDEEVSNLGDDDMVVVTIMGEPTGIKVAKEEIEKIVGEKIGKQTTKVDGLDSKYYLFLAGVDNSNIKKLEQEFDVKIHIPAVIVDGKTNTETAISISGDKDKVQLAKQALEKNYAEIENSSRTIAISIPKRQHKYLYGKNGNELKSIYNASGCTVELPAADDTSDNVTIRGLEPDLVKGLTAVMDKANAVQVTVLDLAENYKATGKDALKNANAALKYLVAKKSLKKVEDEHNVMVSVPENGESVTLEFVSSSGKDAALAQLAVSNLLRDLTPEIFGFVDVKPYLHHYIATNHRSALERIQSSNNVTVIVPEEKENSSDILVVYSGSGKSGAKAAIDAASAELAKIVADSSDYISKTTSIPVNFHDLIRGPRDTTLNALIGETDAIIRFGPKDKVEVRGLSKDVNKVIGELQKAFDAVQEEDYGKPYTEEFFISPNFSAHIIGKSGVHINKLKDDLGVKVDIGENDKEVVSNKKNASPVKVVIQGPKINVEAAKERIQSQIASLADQVTLSLKVPKAFHRYLIGPSGRYVKKLEDKYNVFIKFPRSRGDESPSNPDEITVRGSKKDANAAKDELLELYEYEKEEQEKRKEREQKHKEYEEKRAAEDKRRAEERAAREARDAAKEAAREARKAEKEAAAAKKE